MKAKFADGTPYYCTSCGAGGDLMLCGKKGPCKPEAKEVAEARAKWYAENGALPAVKEVRP